MKQKSPYQNSSGELRHQVLEILSTFTHETLKKNLSVLGAVKHSALLDGVLHIELQMPFAWRSGFEELQSATRDQLLQATGATDIEWLLQHEVATLRRTNRQPPVKGVRNIIAISSGKGGVGKSSTAVNLALALAAEGGKVGILDADIYGPSVPMMLGTTHQRPSSPDGQHMQPVPAYNIVSNSIGYLGAVDDQAMVWRGPMASKALQQLLYETLWSELDYLILDMPPGTGDIQLTLAQSIPVTGAIVVTTPQDIALLDAMKGITMFQKVDVPVLGIIENMSIHVCSQCGHQEAIFGSEGAAKVAEKYQIELLGEMPLHKMLREDLDQGKPTVVSHPDSDFAQLYRQLAGRVAAALYWQGEVIPGEISITTLS